MSKRGKCPEKRPWLTGPKKCSFPTARLRAQSSTETVKNVPARLTRLTTLRCKMQNLKLH